MKKVIDITFEKDIESFFVEPESTVFEAIKKLDSEEMGALLVVENQALTGVFSERDYTRKVVLKGRHSKKTQVKEVMSHEVIKVSPDNTLMECLEVMSDKKVRHLPVVSDSGQVHGFVSILDVANTLLSERQKQIRHLEEYISETWPF